MSDKAVSGVEWGEKGERVWKHNQCLRIVHAGTLHESIRYVGKGGKDSMMALTDSISRDYYYRRKKRKEKKRKLFKTFSSR